MSLDLKLYNLLRDSGIDLVLSVPCILLKGLIKIINQRNEILHIPVCREEEGVGIAAGAHLGGKIPLVLMQNSGLGNSINAIKSLLELYEIPVVFVMSHRGGEGETIAAQIPMGKSTKKLLEVLGIKYWSIRSNKDLYLIKEAISYLKKTNNSVAILLKKSLWDESK
ncbi:MAG: sulfopyruvate decarboxylase subunit alpha [Candidatus Heimdallarchaeota archaeon]